jgi:hypothetical protein
MRGWKLTALTGFLAAATVPVLAAPNFVGQSGNIVTPDDRIVQPREFSAGYNFLDQHIFGTNKSKNLIAANYGFTRALEAGLTYETRDSATACGCRRQSLTSTTSASGSASRPASAGASLGGFVRYRVWRVVL